MAASSGTGGAAALCCRVVTLLACLAVAAAQTDATAWLDVCTAEEYTDSRTELCPTVFFVSTVAFSPLLPKQSANMTIILQPAQNLLSSVVRTQFVRLTLPGFQPDGTVNVQNSLVRDMPLTGNNPVIAGQDAANSYNTPENPVFDSPAQYQTQTGELTMQVRVGQTLLKGVDTEVRVCCVVLPASSVQDSDAYRISAPVSLGTEPPAIADEPIKSSPYIDPGFQFEFVQVQFDPPLSEHEAVISLTLTSSTNLADRSRIILHLPSVSRVTPVSGVIEFNTAGSGDGTDWMFFAHEALWDESTRTLVFFLRDGETLPAHRQVTLRTNPGDFRLPTEVMPNWAGLLLEARSFDNVDTIIRPTPVSQSTEVPHVRVFHHSALAYEMNRPYEVTNVHLTFRTNRPMFPGTSIYLRLSGFQAKVLEVPLLGDTKEHFLNQVAIINLPANELTLRVNKTFYSNEQNFTVIFQNLILPPATYPNDQSLLIWNSDPVAMKQPIDASPAIGGGHKEFIRSQLLFSPTEPRMAANITIILQPSIVFYQGDIIILHLYGFIHHNRIVPLLGPKAYLIKDQAATWVAEETILLMEVAENEIITNVEAFEVAIGLETNFRLPDKLSKNDGICRAEGVGALIYKEPMKKTPQIGETKFVIDSRVEFEPVGNGLLSDSIARILFSVLLNTDVLPNSTIFIQLGGLRREVPNNPDLQSGSIQLSGANAPLFVGSMGFWNSEINLLTVQVVQDVQIYSGEIVRFFIEWDQFFKLPYAMYPSDPSFRLWIPEAGISERPFNFSTRVNADDTKTFTISQLYYGDFGTVSYPNTVIDLTMKFRPNVDIPQGSTIRMQLPGFSCPVQVIPIRLPDVQVVGEAYLSETIRQAIWDQLEYSLDLMVPTGKFVSRAANNVVRILRSDGGFRLPTFALAPNDLRLTIAVIQNQIIFAEPIKESPRVVDRTFAISEFNYFPPAQQNIFMLTMRLQPTVNLTDSNDIVIRLPGFVNSLDKFNIHLIGASSGLIRESMAQWNSTSQELTMLVPFGSIIPAFTVLELRVAESQGFILPDSLNANDTRITIKSMNNIEPAQPIKKSPMVGNGPYSNHLFCMYQFERGVRTTHPLCGSSQCVPANVPLRDPCSPAELERCNCPALTSSPVNVTVFGFQLQEGDQVGFIPASLECGTTAAGYISPFSVAQRFYVAADNDWLAFENISSIESGYYRICMVHVGVVFDVGTVVVRPSCTAPLVLVGGKCVQHCPKTKIPVAGACLRDPVAMQSEERQALMLPIRIDDPLQSPNLASASQDDSERRYFEYRFTYDLASLLNCDPARILVASLSNGSVIANTVFTPVVAEDEPITVSTERSPLGLVELLRSLQNDTSSAMYAGGAGESLFRYIDRSYTPVPIKVRKCSVDGVYRVFCPYRDGTILASWRAAMYFWFGSVGLAVMVVCICGGCWFVDMERPSVSDQEVLEKLQQDPRLVEPEQQLEFASSWLEGRFMGERWQKARGEKVFAIKH